ncbi:hypothetical protein DFJ74DRAFT_672467 [Hyaloraphidium curvatum]|nr:hypothetical protein DFJ74DRAFT_672467 [Hyaloraphidium curvatum]
MSDDEDSDLWVRRVTIPGTTCFLTIREDFAGPSGLGGTIWDPSFILLDVLAANAAAWKLNTLRVAELGSGLGALGLGASALGAPEVLLTERGEDMLEMLQYNVSENQLSGVPGPGGLPKIDVAELDWLEASLEPDTHLAPLVERPFDLVLAAECLYDPSIVLPFLRVAEALAYGIPPDPDREPIILVCGVISDAAWASFSAAVPENAAEGAEWVRVEVPVPELSDAGAVVGTREIQRPDRKCWRLYRLFPSSSHGSAIP